MSCDYCWPGNCCGGPNCKDAAVPIEATHTMTELTKAPLKIYKDITYVYKAERDLPTDGIAETEKTVVAVVG